jgi:hypothetical protein
MLARAYFQLADAMFASRTEAQLMAVHDRIALTEMHPFEWRAVERRLRALARRLVGFYAVALGGGIVLLAAVILARSVYDANRDWWLRRAWRRENHRAATNQCAAQECPALARKPCENRSNGREAPVALCA